MCISVTTICDRGGRYAVGLVISVAAAASSAEDAVGIRMFESKCTRLGMQSQKRDREDDAKISSTNVRTAHTCLEKNELTAKIGCCTRELHPALQEDVDGVRTHGTLL